MRHNNSAPADARDILGLRLSFPGLCKLSDAALECFALMGGGMRLRVSHADGSVQVVEGLARYGKNRPSHNVTMSAARELMDSGLISKLTEHRDNERIGWREAGYDGDAADWWCCTQ